MDFAAAWSASFGALAHAPQIARTPLKMKQIRSGIEAVCGAVDNAADPREEVTNASLKSCRPVP
jgi:hypothetical protein